MGLIYLISGFSNYYIKDRVLYRKAYKTPSKTYKWQFRQEREISKTFNNSIEGYMLEKDGKRKFYSLQSLRHRLKLETCTCFFLLIFVF